jgi:preprotein translocase subunit SecE
MARNRKRAKERRARHPERAGSRSRMAAASAEATPEPLAHATPDVELADAQIALGRARFDRETEQAGRVEPQNGEASHAEPEEPFGGEPQAFDAEPELELSPVGGRGNGSGSPPPPAIAVGPGGGAAVPAEPRGAVAAEARVTLLARLIGFLQGSWRELQRVQWPDRRQVAQATSVVIGFVIVAGVFLGIADLAFSHLMNYVLYGK